MISYTQGRNMAAIWSKNSDASNLAFLDLMANNDYRHLCGLKDWPWLERRRTLTSLASTQFYTLPFDCDQVRAVAFQPVGSNNLYVLEEIASRDQWDYLNLNTYTSDTPEAFFVFDGRVGIWPTPASAGSSIFITQKSRVIDLSMPDYSAGTIATATNGGTTITGSSTNWTTQMVGRWIRITYSDTANTGDGLWYEIVGVTNATTLTIGRAYGGSSITAGTAAYTIGQMPLLPEAYQDMPWVWATGMYWQKEADNRATSYFQNHGQSGGIGTVPTGRVKELIGAWSTPSTGLVIDNGDSEQDFINPNLTVRL